jgi:hypothetical protein
MFELAVSYRCVELNLQHRVLTNKETLYGMTILYRRALLVGSVSDLALQVLGRILVKLELKHLTE